MTTAHEVLTEMQAAGVLPRCVPVDRDPMEFTYLHELSSGAIAVVDRETLRSVEIVRKADERYALCGWMVEAWGEADEDGMTERIVRDCAAPAVYDARGFRCCNGHEHVSAEHRANEGWDYAHSF